MIVAYLGLMFAASAPSPLYVVYQARWHFSAITLTSIFGVYALALLLTLLTVGGLSDFVGRKPVLLAGFVSLAASMVVFARADGVGWLYVARALQGLAAGSSLGALSAGIVDFAGPKRQRFAGVVNSLVPSLGLALGALGAGGLVQFAPAPTVLVFLVLGALFALVLLAVAAGPETEQSRGGPALTHPADAGGQATAARVLPYPAGAVRDLGPGRVYPVTDNDARGGQVRPHRPLP